MPAIEIPEGWSPPVVGIFVGGCVERGDGSRFRRQAHAHTGKHDAHRGWICILSARRVYTPSGKPSRLMFHEYAHHLAPSDGHGKRWQKKLTELGFPAEAQQVARQNAEWRQRHAARTPMYRHTCPECSGTFFSSLKETQFMCVQCESGAGSVTQAPRAATKP